MPRDRPFLYLGIFLIVPLALGCLLAPGIFQGVKALGEYPIFARVAEERFERVATRTVQVIALLLIWPCLKYSGTVSRVGPMLTWSRGRGAVFLKWFGFGVLSMAAVYIVGFAAGVYGLDSKRFGTVWMIIDPLTLLLGALLVGALEEYLFRGFVFGVLQTRLSMLSASVVSSAFFSAVHFLRPRLAAPPENVTWTSGFELIPHMFTLFRPAYDWDFALTLFLMGLTLCALLMHYGHFYGIAGLHAGWVWVLQTGNHLVDQMPRRHTFWFGWGDNPAQGALVTFLATGFAAASWLALCRAHRSCQTRLASDTTKP